MGKRDRLSPIKKGPRFQYSSSREIGPNNPNSGRGFRVLRNTDRRNDIDGCCFGAESTLDGTQNGEDSEKGRGRWRSAPIEVGEREGPVAIDRIPRSDRGVDPTWGNRFGNLDAGRRGKSGQRMSKSSGKALVVCALYSVPFPPLSMSPWTFF